jgi:hypothetical protein
MLRGLPVPEAGAPAAPAEPPETAEPPEWLRPPELGDPPELIKPPEAAPPIPGLKVLSPVQLTPRRATSPPRSGLRLRPRGLAPAPSRTLALALALILFISSTSSTLFANCTQRGIFIRMLETIRTWRNLDHASPPRRGAPSPLPRPTCCAVYGHQLSKTRPRRYQFSTQRRFKYATKSAFCCAVKISSAPTSPSGSTSFSPGCVSEGKRLSRWSL